MLAEATGGDIAIAVVAAVGVIVTALSPVLMVIVVRRTGKLERHATEAKVAAQVATATAATAKANAATAAHVAADIKSTLGVPNGNGNVTQMLERLLGESAETKAWQKNAGLWMADHDVKDDATRADVNEIKTYLGMPNKEST